MTTKIKTSLLAGLSALLLLFPSLKTTELADISKPYLGTYECTQAKLGAFDCLDRFDDIRLEFISEDAFILYYKEKGGARKKAEGRYRYDKEKKVIVVQDERGGISREFPFKEGKLTVFFPVGKKELVLQFERQ